MGFMDKIRGILLKSKSEITKTQENETRLQGFQTRYGKMLDLSPAEKSKLVESLTPREKETFFILLGGYSLKETAKQLSIGYSTVNTYQTAIYRKLCINSRAELIINYRDACETRENDS